MKSGKLKLKHVLLFAVIGIIIMTYISIFDEGGQSSRQILQTQSLIESGLFIFAYTLAATLIFLIIKRFTQTILALIGSAFISIPAGYATYLGLLFMISVFV